MSTESDQPSAAAAGEAAPTAYEFSLNENDVIRKLAKYLRDIGALLMLLAVLAALGTLGNQAALFSRSASSEAMQQPGLQLAMVNGMVNVILLFLIGWYMRSAGRSFESVVQTTGDDILHLMQSLGSLNKLYAVKIVALTIGIVVAVAMYFLPPLFPLPS